MQFWVCLNLRFKKKCQQNKKMRQKQNTELIHTHPLNTPLHTWLLYATIKKQEKIIKVFFVSCYIDDATQQKKKKQKKQVYT